MEILTALMRKIHRMTERDRFEEVDQTPMEGFVMHAEPSVRELMRRYMANETARLEFFRANSVEETEEEANDFDLVDDELPEISGLETVFIEEPPPEEEPEPEPPAPEPEPEPAAAPSESA